MCTVAAGTASGNARGCETQLSTNLPARGTASSSIVRQSASARWVGFLAVCVVALFTIAYYFYEVGLPLELSTPRLAAEADAQQVTAVERGYNLYEANCARCHGPAGKGTEEGYIAPPLNDQMKLFDHLSAAYLKSVLTVGGRYVCGDPKSLMPVWANTNGGPLNYIEIEDLIAFMRSDSTQEFVIRNPELNEPIIGADGKVKTFRGWVDPSFKPDPAVYRHFIDSTGSDQRSTWLVSGNSFDVLGASAVGWRTAWVKRDSGAIFDPWDVEPTVTVGDLRALAVAVQQAVG